jgi:hypothetical protein
MNELRIAFNVTHTREAQRSQLKTGSAKRWAQDQLLHVSLGEAIKVITVDKGKHFCQELISEIGKCLREEDL